MAAKAVVPFICIWCEVKTQVDVDIKQIYFVFCIDWLKPLPAQDNREMGILLGISHYRVSVIDELADLSQNPGASRRYSLQCGNLTGLLFEDRLLKAPKNQCSRVLEAMKHF